MNHQNFERIIALTAAARQQIISLREGARAEASQDGAPQWNKLFPVGVTRYRDADFPEGITFSRQALATMVANWAKAGKPPKQVNYFHRGSTEYGDITPIELKVAAGWIEDLELREDGLYGLIRWTEKARAHIKADELRYLSPEFSMNGQDKASGGGQGPTLYGCALLNDPYLEELPRVAASNTPPTAAQAAGAEKMDRLKLIALLGLAANATDADIEKALQDSKLELGELKAKVTALEQEKAQRVELANGATQKLAALENANTKLAADLKASTDRLTALENERREAAVETYLTDLVKAGKLPPAMRDGVKAHALSAGLDAVKAIWDKAPVMVQLGERGIPGEPGQKPAGTEHAKYTTLMDQYEKEGLSPMQADRRIRAEHPELVKPTTLGAKPTA